MTTPPADYRDLSAIYVNCTLKPSPQPSHTQTLIDRSAAIMNAQGVTVDQVRAVDLDLAPGVQPDMTEHGFEADDGPHLVERVLAADILVLATPIWLGERSSVASRVVERLYAVSGQENDKGQGVFYGRTAGVVVTGNEDGLKHVGMNTLFALQHIGYMIPPQADAGWIGEAGPGPSYGDEPEDGGLPVGFDNDFTDLVTTTMTWNLLHTARMLRDGGLPAHGNVPSAWQDGERWDYPAAEQ